MRDVAAGDGSRNVASTAVALGVVLLGTGILAGLVYTDLTTTVTREEYAAFQANCDDLANGSQLVDAGVGLRREPLDESHAASCRNASFEAYRSARVRAMDRPPLNARQWGLYGGAGLAFLSGGAVLLRQELARW